MSAPRIGEADDAHRSGREAAPRRGNSSIEVSVVDADGNEHRIIDKVPVLTTAELMPP